MENEKKETDLIKPEEENKNENLSIISDSDLIGVYDEIMVNLREDRNQVENLIETFSNMVINDGDPSSSSKEALVNLVKVKIDASDKMSKIADLMTRVKLKQPDTYPPWMNKNKKESNNTINIYDSSGINRKTLMERIKKEELANE
jgi:hypothetical protein